MIQASVKIDQRQVVGVADPMIFGQYTEHLSPDERCIYGAIVDEPSPLTDERGFRVDVIDAVRELGVPVTRWPGGCFADIYHWEDGIGPVDQRPVRRNWHWGGLESNRFGTDEFLAWCQAVETTPYINFNIGTGTLDEAIRWLDYCNGREMTHEVQLRTRYGQAEPYGVPLWGIGNEQWGHWEANHMTAQEYAARLSNWAPFFRKLDPQARFLGIGSPAADDPEWDLAVLKSSGHLIEYLTIHMYAHCLRGVATDEEYYATVTAPHFFEERLQVLAALIDATTGHLERKPRIALDEWNIRHMVPQADGTLQLDRSSPRTLSDALFVAGVFHAMLRLAPSMAIGCYVFLLNGNGVIRVTPSGVVKTPLFDVFQLYQRVLFSTVLQARVTSEEILTGVRQRRIGQVAMHSVPYVDVIPTYDADTQQLALALINRHRSQSAQVQLDIEHLTCHGTAAVWELFDDDILAANDETQPDRLRLSETSAEWSNEITLKPHSLKVIRVACGS